jgi:multiple sugar transport system permease protein
MATTVTLATRATRWDLTSPKRYVSRVAVWVVLAIITLAFIGPMLWLVFGSVSKGSGLNVNLSSGFTLANFRAVMNGPTLWTPLMNSFILSAGTAILTVACAALAAYPLSRYQMRYRKPFLYTILFSTGLPVTAIMVPVYAMFSHFSLTDSIPATIFFMSATSLPFAIWLMKNFMDGVPVSLEEASWVDGANWIQSLTRIVLPLMLPGVAVVAIFVFVQQWGDFFIPFILLLSPDKQPASVSIYTFFSNYGQVAYGQLAAFSILYTAPVVVLYVIMSRYLGGAFSFAGGVKG